MAWPQVKLLANINAAIRKKPESYSYNGYLVGYEYISTLKLSILNACPNVCQHSYSGYLTH